MKKILSAAAIQTLVCFQVQALAAGNEGFLVKNASGEKWNEVTIVRSEYTGECPGVTETKVEAYFRTNAIEPKKGQKVIIQNLSLSSAGSRLPYTERDYDKGLYADRTYLGLSDEHRGKFLAVQEGENQFYYRVFNRDDQTISSGQFSAEVNVFRPEPQNRDKVCRWESSCNEYVCVPVLYCDCPAD